MALLSVRSAYVDELSAYLAYVDKLSAYLGGCYANHYAVPDHLVRICVEAVVAQKFKVGDKLSNSRVALYFVVKLIPGEQGV